MPVGDGGWGVRCSGDGRWKKQTGFISTSFKRIRGFLKNYI